MDSTSLWKQTYARRVILTDLVAITWAVGGAQLLSFGFSLATVSGIPADDLNVSYAAVSIALIIAWMALLHLAGSRDPAILGVQTTEFRRVVTASFALFGAVAIAAYLARIEIARAYLLTALPLGIVMLLLSRWMWRSWLRAHRSRGQFSYRVLVVGSEENSTQFIQQLVSLPAAGYRVVGIWNPAIHGSDGSDWEAELDNAIRSVHADTVAIVGSDALTPERVRRISWRLDPDGMHLILAPSLLGVAGPRIHSTPVAGLPLLHVEIPRFAGSKHRVKRTFDFIGSLSITIALSPVLLVLSALVLITSRGPVFFRQVRVGLNGEEFRMFKFRSMRQNADSELAALLAAQGTADTPLFKVKNDPRVTPLGRILRKYSLDELPQLLNVISGDMSLVGPRPQVPKEVELYDSVASRRLLLKPGMSGLWQVSGRSSLSWEDAIRLDLYYVENWSIGSDIAILWRTAKAMVAPGDDAF
jgi:exopolysaccharide biosynthesis polyprenyl glycosylphosphotransferase